MFRSRVAFIDSALTPSAREIFEVRSDFQDKSVVLDSKHPTSDIVSCDVKTSTDQANASMGLPA